VKLKPLDIPDRATVQRILADAQNVIVRPVQQQPREKGRTSYVTWKGKKLDVASPEIFRASPFGHAGRVVYVREPWMKVNDSTQRVLLAADYDSYDPFQNTRWRTTSTMPNDAARLFLYIDFVGICRLQSMDQQAMLDSGISSRMGMTMYEGKVRNVFAGEWDRLYKDERRGWDKNPFVWAARFTRAPLPPGHPNEDPFAPGRDLYRLHE